MVVWCFPERVKEFLPFVFVYHKIQKLLNEIGSCFPTARHALIDEVALALCKFMESGLEHTVTSGVHPHLAATTPEHLISG